MNIEELTIAFYIANGYISISDKSDEHERYNILVDLLGDWTYLVFNKVANKFYVERKHVDGTIEIGSL